jgi:hypothetical protein
MYWASPCLPRLIRCQWPSSAPAPSLHPNPNNLSLGLHASMFGLAKAACFYCARFTTLAAVKRKDISPFRPEFFSCHTVPFACSVRCLSTDSTNGSGESCVAFCNHGAIHNTPNVHYSERVDKLDDKKACRRSYATSSRHLRRDLDGGKNGDKASFIARARILFARARFTMTEIPIALGIHMSKEQEH